MLTTWTIESVERLAPNPRLLETAKRLAQAKKWQELGVNGSILWGRYRRYAGRADTVTIDLATPLLDCSCSAATKPCAHSLALLLLYVRQRNAFMTRPLAPWVTDWLETRYETASPAGSPNLPQDPNARHKFRLARLQAAAPAMDNLRRWLYDMLREGTNGVAQRPFSLWDDMARQMENVGCDGVAAQIRQLARAAALNRDGWPEQLLAGLARLHLLVVATGRFDQLSPAQQYDLLMALGFSPTISDVLPDATAPAAWLVVGQQQRATFGATQTHYYLWQPESDQLALACTETPAAELALASGTLVTTQLRYFPSATPLLALLQTPTHVADAPAGWLAGAPTLAAAHARFGLAVGQLPWLQRWPLLAANVTVQQHEANWYIVDPARHFLPLHARFDAEWSLFAFGAGRPISLLGEWDGATLWPLAAHGRDGWVDFPTARSRDERLV